MDVRLSPEQQQLRESAAKVVADLGPRAVGELDDPARIAKLDAAVTAAGWRDLRTAGDDDAPWGGSVEVCVVAEQLGHGLADTAFVGPTLAAELRRIAGAEPSDQPETVAFCADLGDLAVVGDGNAAQPVAVDVAGATTALALAVDSEGWGLAQLDLAEPRAQVDLTRPLALVDPGSARSLAGRRTVTADDRERLRALGTAIVVADLVGAMQGAVDLATDYARDRRQYGQPVGAFQAVQHLLADALVATEGSRTLSLYASWAVDALDPGPAAVAAATAKAYAGRAARLACETSIQVHGGIGNTWECLAHVFLRRAQLSTDLFGGVGPSLQRVLDDRLGAA